MAPVEAVRAIFGAFRGDAPLKFEGSYWSFSLLPAQWSPGPIDVPDPPIDLAAVSPWMLRMAGEVADGVHVHPLNTPTYLSEPVVISDELLSHFVVRGSWDELPGLIVDRLGGVAARAIAYFAGMAWAQDSGFQERWGDVARAITSSSGA